MSRAIAPGAPRRVEVISQTGDLLDTLRFFEGAVLLGERLSPDDFTSRTWRDHWLEGRVDDPDELSINPPHFRKVKS